MQAAPDLHPLILLARSKDARQRNDAFAALRRELEISTYLVARRWFGKIDRDEITSTADQTILEIVDSYDPTRGAKVHHFFRFAFGRRLSTLWMSRTQTRKHPKGKQVVSLDAPQTDNGLSLSHLLAAAPETHQNARSELRRVWTLLAPVLSPQERETLLQVEGNGESYEQTASIIGKDVKAVDNTMQRVRAKLADLRREAVANAGDVEIGLLDVLKRKKAARDLDQREKQQAAELGVYNDVLGWRIKGFGTKGSTITTRSEGRQYVWPTRAEAIAAAQEMQAERR